MAASIDRREFLNLSAATLAVGTLGATGLMKTAVAGENRGRIKKAVKYQMITGKLSVLDKFKLVKDLGFDGVEPRTRDKLDRRQLLAASEKTGVKIHGVINSNSPDITGAVDQAVYYGGDSVLVVAGRVNEKMRYDKNYEEWLGRLRKAAPYAEKKGIRLLVENVWNNFLLSPLEMARFIDEIESPAVGVYFDVGNIVRFGWPDQWIRILGKRVGKLDIKEYSRKKQRDEGLWKGFGVKIGDGDCNWPEVRKALAEIKFSGWATAEVGGGGRERLAEIAERMNKVLDL